MNVTFLIGNGFDINLGMKTSFKDFNEYYIGLPSAGTKEEIELLNEFKKDLFNDCDTWADAELAFGKYSENYNDKKQFDIVFRDYINKLNNYLKIEQNNNNINDEYKKIFEAFVLEFQNHFSNVNFIVKDERPNDDTYDVYCYFINFNYTDSIMKLFGSENDSNNNNEMPMEINQNVIDEKLCDYYYVDTINIHGTLDNKMIFGVDSISQIANFDFRNFEFASEFVKTVSDKIVGENNERNAKDYIFRSNIICSYGLSFGKSDFMWWDTIVKWLEMDKNHVWCIFNYHNDNDINNNDIFCAEDEKIEILNRIISDKTEKGMNEKYHIADQIKIASSRAVLNFSK